MSQFHTSVLPNGLRIATDAMPNMETVAIAFSVDVGARWETPEQHGISHLLEHMAFKGTPSMNALQIAEAFDAIGGQFNAFTSHEHTVYYAKILREDWRTACDILTDILQHSLIDEEELAREKQVILQELAAHFDTPDDLVFDLYQEMAFGKNTALGRSILGTADSITRHSRADLLDYIAHHYHPSRIVVSAAGAIAHDELSDYLSGFMESAPNAAAMTMPTAHYSGGFLRQSRDLEQLQLIIGLESAPLQSKDYYTLQLLTLMLGGGMSSRLFQEVREKRGLVYSIYAMNASYMECGAFSIYAATSAEDVKQLVPLIASELQRFASDVSQEELQRAKQQQISSLRMARESTATLAEWIGRHMLHYGEYRDVAALTQAVNTVRLADIQSLATQLFHKPKLSMAALGPVQTIPDDSAILSYFGS